MIGLIRTDHEIFIGIVHAVAIIVMNNNGGGKRPAKHPFRDQNVFRNIPADVGAWVAWN